jgi:flagella basal body P-ring formation protein FlgA
MRALGLCISLLVTSMLAHGAAAPAAIIHAQDEQTLKQALVALTQQRLDTARLRIDEEGVWLSLSRPLTDPDVFEVRAAWLAGNEIPASPVKFELLPEGERTRPLQATLVIATLREQWLIKRRLRKGSAVVCDDLSLQWRKVRVGQQSSYAPPNAFGAAECDLANDAVALRDLSARDVVHVGDIGKAPHVMAGSAVRLSVFANAIQVTTTATALADANAGDQIQVRLARPNRTLRTRVTGPGTVQLLEGAQ